MASMWKLGGLTWKDMGKRVWSEINKDDVFGRSAQLAYYFLLALFPLLLFVTSVIGLMLGSGTGLRHNLFNYLGQVLPSASAELVSNTMRDVSESSGGSKLSFGIIAALWAASNGMGAISESLNAAYSVKETRPWWKTRVTAVLLTIALALLIITALVLVLYGGRIAEGVAGHFGLGDVFTTTWRIAQWPIVLAFVLLAYGLIYYFAPDTRNQGWKWVTPGAGVGVVLWLLVSFGFRLYLSYFNSYGATYGSLGAVIILMLWFYLTGAAVLIGGEINSEIEHEMAKRGAPDAKEHGEKSPGQKSSGEKQSRGREAKGVGKAASARTGNDLENGPAHTANKRPRSQFSLGKAAVVLGAWFVGKLSRSSGTRRNI